jgi:D-glycero-D-manno-heptose 1,7-bisphosphate phosphatase
MKLAILDRDGVINYDSDHYIKSPAEWRLLPGAIEAIARPNQNGFRIAVATNQSCIGRGLFDMLMLNAINDKMMELVSAGGARRAVFCPHTAVEECACRKP